MHTRQRSTPRTGVRRLRHPSLLSVLILLALLCGATLWSSVAAPTHPASRISFTFTRVVDTNSPIPGGIGNFIFFTDPFTTVSLDGHPAVSIENGTVVFSVSGPFGQR